MQKVKISIGTKTMVRFLLVVIGFALAGLIIYKAQVALMIIGVSAFMAVALNTPVTKLANLLPGRSRVAATALSYVAIVALLGTLITLVVPPVVEQTAKFTSAIPSIANEVVDRWTILHDVLEKYGLESSLDEALASIQQMATNFAGNIGKAAIGSIGSLMDFITALILVLVLTFLMLMEGPSWINKYFASFSTASETKKKQQQNVLKRIYGVITGYVNGQLMVSAIGAVVAGIMVFILSLLFTDMPSNLSAPIAVITFVLSLIPMFGAVIAGTIAAIILAMNSLPAAIIYVVFFVIYQQIENNFISPTIQGKQIALSALIILISVTIGVYMFGILGGIIAIPIAGTIQVLLDEYYFNKPKNDNGTAKSSSSNKKLVTNKK